MTSEDFFHRIESHYKNNLPFVVYRKPNSTTIFSLLQNTDDLFFTENFTETGFVFSPFDTLEKTILLPSNCSEKGLLKNTDNDSVVDKKLKSNSNSNTSSAQDKECHINLINKGISAIQKTDIKKVVLSRTETIHLSENNPISIFKKLVNAYKLAFVYCWYHPKVGLWLGATPETLIKMEGNRFSIMALAGTQDYQGTLDVVWQKKEKQEQQFVTDFIVENLKPCVENCNVSKVETVKAGNLLHLKTIITAQLKTQTQLKQVIKALHPTPAVCGLPQQDAKQFILEHEAYNREFYTGFLGELNFETTLSPRLGTNNIENKAYAFNKKSTQFYVNLRCMQIQNKNAIIYVGGGITKHSDAESEWNETVSKTLVIKNML